MKKFFTLIIALMATTCMMAQSHGAMTFVGKSNISVLTASIDNESDTVKFAMNDMTSGNITLPSVSFSMGAAAMTIPSVTIHNAQFTMDMATMTATFADQTFTETVTIDGSEKTITGTHLYGTYNHSDNTLDLTIKFKYGSMPYEATYTFKGYYVKTVEGTTVVSISGQYTYTATPTYSIRKYIEDEVEKIDVEIPTYLISETVMGNITLGTYTVKGLTYDSEKKGYYRDYAKDGLAMHFYSTMGYDKDYDLSKEGAENILVQYDGSNVVYIENNFQPGAMPFPITATYGSKQETAVSTVAAVESNHASARKVIKNGRLMIIANGAEYSIAGQRVK